MKLLSDAECDQAPQRASILSDADIETSAGMSSEGGSAPASPATVSATERAFDKRLVLEGVWTVGVRVVGIGTAVAVDVALSRLLAPADAGVVFLLMSVLAFCGMLGVFGLNAVMTRFASEGLGQQNSHATHRSLQIGWRIEAVSIPLAALGCWIALTVGGEALFHVPQAARVAPLLAICVLALPVLQINSSVLRSFHAPGLATLFTGQSGGPLANVLFLAAMGGMVWASTPTVVSTIALNALALGVMAPVSLWCLKRVSTSRLASLPLSEGTGAAAKPTFALLIATCLPLLMSQFLSYCTGFGDLWIAGSIVPHDQLALYAAARRLMLLVGMPLQFVNLIVIASISELRSQGRLMEMQRMLRGYATAAAVPASIAIAALLLFPAQIAALVFGPYYAEAAPVLMLLCLGQLAFVSAGSAELALMMTGYQRAALVINLLTSLLLVTLGIPATRYFGITGLAAVNAGVIAIQVLLFSICVKRRLGVWTIVDPKACLAAWNRVRGSKALDAGGHAP